MTASTDIITRGSTVSFSFTFYDANDAVAVLTSAELELTYRRYDEMYTETITLTEADGVWSTTWNSTRASPGWVDYHAHGVSVGGDFAEDGRFKLDGNRAGLQHDILPNITASNDYTEQS